MNEVWLLRIIMFGTFSLLGFGMIRIGLQGRRRDRERLERERMRVTGTIVEVVREYRRMYRRGAEFWYPVVEYRAGGRDYRVRSQDDLPRKWMSVGESVELLCDADDPARFHLEKWEEHRRLGDRNLILFGSLWVLLTAGLVMLLKEV